MDLDKYRADSLANWDRLSAAWSREREFVWRATRPVGERMVEILDPQPGQTVLELAAGIGDTGFAAAARLGDEGKLISTDFSPGMVEEAGRAAAEMGLGNVEHRVLDAERMDLEDSSVDGVLCRFGYMLMADPAAALAETRRVLRDGGRLCFAVWASPDRNLWAAIPGIEMIGRGHLPPPDPGNPGIFGLADTDRIRELVAGAGFGDPDIEQVGVTWDYGTADEHWRMTMELAGPLAEAIRNLPEDERESVRAAVAEKVDEALAGGGVGGLVHVIRAA